MNGSRLLSRSVPFAVLLLLLSSSILFPGGAGEVEKAGWEESTPGRWTSRAESRAEAGPDFFRAEVSLSPGTGAEWERRITKELVPDDSLSIEMESTGINKTSRDYRRFEAKFPVSVTVVFGKDSVGLSWRRRVKDFFRELWYGFTPGGIRLTFAYGNDAPVHSMYRLVEEETVFTLGAQEELGKKIERSRKIIEDFRAAYGRNPRGPVTRILVSAIRPSGEEGKVEVGIRLTSSILR